MVREAIGGDPAVASSFLKERFEEAAATDEPVERDLLLADRNVKLRVVGRELAQRIIRPLAHLQKDSSTGSRPALTIDLWDQRATQAVVGSVPGFPEPVGERISTSIVDTRFSLSRHRSSILWLDRAAGKLIGGFPSFEDLSLYELGRPLHAPLTHWHNDQGVPVVHAGLVVREGRGVLVAGPPGAGKSTTAITTLLGGFNYLSDDLIALEEVTDTLFHGHSIYNSTYLDPDHLKRFPMLAARAVTSRYSDEDKLLVLLHELFPTRVKRTARIDLILLPEVGSNTETGFEAVASAKALMALAPPSLVVNSGLGAYGFDMLARLAECVPAYRLHLGSDLGEIPSAVEALLEEIG